MISRAVSEKVLVIGPQYKDHRGGMGALIAVQKDYYTTFNFIPTYQCYSNNLLKVLFFIQQLGKIIWYLTFHREIKVLHVHSAKDGSIYRKLIVILIAKMVFKKKIINHLHSGAYNNIYNSSSSFKRMILMKYFKMSDATFTVSTRWKEYISTQFKLNAVYLINNIVPAVNIEKSNKDNHREVKFLFLGLIGDNKGIFDLLQVLIDNKEDLLGKACLLVGGNGEVDKMKKIVSENGLGEIVEFKGWVSGIEKQRLLQEADIYILPSYSEGMPISILEAMSYGMPIISTDVGGIPEIVQENVNGKIIKPGDLKELYKAIEFYLSSPGKIQCHGIESLKIIKEYFPDAVIPKIETVYKSLVS
jgi:glycosyltransferase involved in cell wall biosynthesis